MWQTQLRACHTFNEKKKKNLFNRRRGEAVQLELRRQGLGLGLGLALARLGIGLGRLGRLGLGLHGCEYLRLSNRPSRSRTEPNDPNMGYETETVEAGEERPVV